LGLVAIGANTSWKWIEGFDLLKRMRVSSWFS